MSAPKLASSGGLLYSYIVPDGSRVEFTQTDILHIRGLSSDGIIGYAPIALHRDTFAHAGVLAEYGSRFFTNDSRPGGVLQTPNKLTKEATDRLKTGWEAAHRGLTNAHRVAVLEEGLEWKTISVTPEEAQYLDSRRFTREEIAGIFRVPPHKIGELERATFSNIEEQSISYVSETLQSWLVRWEQQVNKDLFTPAEQRVYFVEHLMDAKLRGKTLERFQGYATLLNWGVLSPNDVREKENMNPIADGDSYFQPLNMAPLGTDPTAALPAATVRREIQRTADGYRLIESRNEL